MSHNDQPMVGLGAVAQLQAQVRDLEHQVADLEARLNRVRQLHSETPRGWCRHCCTQGPCPTRRAWSSQPEDT